MDGAAAGVELRHHLWAQQVHVRDLLGQQVPPLARRLPREPAQAMAASQEAHRAVLGAARVEGQLQREGARPRPKRPRVAGSGLG